MSKLAKMSDNLYYCSIVSDVAQKDVTLYFRPFMTDVETAPWYKLGLEYDGKQGDRINDHHLAIFEKQAAKEQING